MTTPREFEWSLRLRDGRYLQRCIGTSIEDAAKRAGVAMETVRRALPTAMVLTAEEIAARKARFETLRKRNGLTGMRKKQKKELNDGSRILSGKRIA